MKLFGIAAAVSIAGSVLMAPAASADPQQFQECVKRNGIDVDLPPPPKGAPRSARPPAPPGVKRDDWDRAMLECAQYATPPEGRNPRRHR